MSVKIVIPARYGSSRLPGKPLLQLLGKPVVFHVVERCKEAGISVKDIFIATDDEKIVDALKFYDVQVVMTSILHQSGTDRIHEVAQLKRWSDDTVVINVQGDEPMIPPSLIQEIALFATEHEKFDITTAVVPLATIEDFNNLNVVKAIIGKRNNALYFTRSPAPMNRENPQDIALARRHVGIYSYRVSALKEFCSYKEESLEDYEKLEQLRALSYGMSIGAIVYSEQVPHGIDTIEDFKNIQKFMEEKNQHVKLG